MPHSEQAGLMEKDCLRQEDTCDTEETVPAPKLSAASSGSQRLAGMIGSSKEKAVMSLVDSSCHFKH